MNIKEKLCEPFGGLKKETANKLEKIADNNAIDFADWLNNGRFSQYGSYWTNPKLPKNSKGDWIFFTSKQLYEIFKQENEK